MRDLNDMIPAFQLPHVIQFFGFWNGKKCSFPQLSQEYLNHYYETIETSLFLKNGSKICPRIPIFPNFVSHELLEIIGFPTFLGESQFHSIITYLCQVTTWEIFKIFVKTTGTTNNIIPEILKGQK